MTLVAGIGALLIGWAYTTLGVITMIELLRDRRLRGFSQFGGAFMVMAYTCGPHHLAHSAHVLFEGHAAPTGLTIITLLGLGPGLTFAALRLEAFAGGRGDRVVPGTARWVALAPWLTTLVAGAVLGVALTHPAAGHHLSWGGLPSVVLGINYGIVGILMVTTQGARRRAEGNWSLSGLSLSWVFVPCALMHLTASATGAVDTHMLVIDAIGVPASFWFLWVTHRLHHKGMRDWNRRPLVGRATTPARLSPWHA
jgi:hypothetical protein